MVDFSKLYAKMEAVEPAKEDREYIKRAGKHVVRLVTVDQRESQQGKELVIIEMEVLSSSAYQKGDGLKQIFALSNEPAWRIDQNLGLIRALINATLPGIDLDQTIFESCVSGGNESALAGQTVMVISTEKIAKTTQKPYLSFSYRTADADTVVEGGAPTTTNSAPTVVKVPPSVTVAVEDEEEPSFDI